MREEVMNDILLCLFLFTVVIAIVDLVRVVTENYPLPFLVINIGCACFNYFWWQKHKKENNL